MEAALKGRARRRAVTRKSLLLDLATPWGTKARLTQHQARAAFMLDADMAARWGSGCRISDYGQGLSGSGDRPLRSLSDYRAEARIARLQAILRPHERHLLGEIERLNWEPKGGLARLPVETGVKDEETRLLIVLGHVRAFLNTVGEFYGVFHAHEIAPKKPPSPIAA